MSQVSYKSIFKYVEDILSQEENMRDKSSGIWRRDLW